jgi:hypothetical protein
MNEKNPSNARTIFACFCEGSLKFGIPLLTASTPVSAVQPEEKALRQQVI